MTSTTINKVCILGASGLVAQETIKAFTKHCFALKLVSRNIDAQKYMQIETCKADVFNDKELSFAIDGCDAIHITLSQLDEYAALTRIISAARSNGNIKLISFVSGATVCKENTHKLSFIDAKYRCEQALKESGFDYLILRPTWFMESLSLMIQDGKANVIGKQPNKLRWIASKDFANVLVNAYEKPETYNQELSVYGPQALTINEALSQYVKVKHPQIKKVNNAPFWLLKTIAWLTKNQQLKDIIPVFEYFETTTEVGSPDTTERLVGKPQTRLSEWLAEH